MSKRILWIGEAPYLNTGYGTYTKNVLEYLSKNGVEVFQLGVYCKEGDNRIHDYPWTIIPNEPKEGKNNQEYSSNETNQFGSWKFEQVCAKIKPDVVCNIADFWMFEFIFRSPYINNFKTIIMPTCDAAPQPKQWTEVYSRIDKIFAYNDWSAEEMRNRLGDLSYKVIGSAPPVAHSDYRKKDKLKLRHSMGLGLHETIFGTVMRNQKRKLFPELFSGFRKFLDNGGDAKLLCHTSYPDRGWDIQGLLKRYNLSSQVFFTYKCVNCEAFSIEPFKSIIKQCGRCSKISCKLCNVDDGISTEDLSNVYNIMDLYIQPCTNEGFGMPLVEAAACGIPIAATNYSAPKDILEKLNGYKLSYYLNTEAESGMYKAVTSSDDISDLMMKFWKTPKEIINKKSFETRSLFEKHYNSWSKTAEKWLEEITKTEKGSWNNPTKIELPEVDIPEGIKSSYDLSCWIIKNTLKDTSKLYTLMHARLIRDLSFGFVRRTIGGEYDHEMPAMQMFHEELSPEDLVAVFANKRKLINDCEKLRIS